jgi:hypothetical protein
MAAKRISKNEKIHCNRCRGKTLQRLAIAIRGDEGTNSYGPDYDFSWRTLYEVLQCAGCQEAVLRSTTDDSESEYSDVRYFPPAISRHPPQWKYQLPGEITLLLDEVYRSLDAANRQLPMMGARAIVDLVMVEKVGDIGTFAGKLEKLESGKFISASSRKVLKAVLDIGSAAAHRGYLAKKPQIDAVMDIIENLLQAVYVFPDMAEELEKSTPARPRKTKL